MVCQIRPFCTRCKIYSVRFCILVRKERAFDLNVHEREIAKQRDTLCICASVW